MSSSNPSRSFVIRPCTQVYLALMGLTATTYLIGTAAAPEQGPGLGLSLLVLGFALLKSHLIGDYFMGLRGLHGPWRWVILLWLLIPGGLILTAFVLSA
ncbi:cytochrome C oxidase subunit IV family protein [Thiocystis violacea]|uniref:cytochrome C oxidase subunit IV family protein n=1 Tax=Thiocystis violacea TaxID=13725 RepID=UPI0019074215|nr:cytochrome C oxidase subunit IV family protein [Thiocystis violacea]MBK1717349.1 hypothetical protein [Thiocystis violacea]